MNLHSLLPIVSVLSFKLEFIFKVYTILDYKSNIFTSHEKIEFQGYFLQKKIIWKKMFAEFPWISRKIS